MSEAQDWSDGSEHSLMLFHPGRQSQQPIVPSTLQTLATSQNKSASPSSDHQQQAAVGSGTALTGLSRVPVPREAQQIGVAQPKPKQLSPKKEKFQAKSSGEHPNPDSATTAGHANPSRGHDGVGGSVAAESLTVLMWVHPAAAREAWKTLTNLAQGLGIGCTSRSVET